MIKRARAERVDPDRARCPVAGAGGFGGLLDAVAVVPGALDRAETVTCAAGRDQQVGDVSQVLGQLISPVLRGNVRRPGGGAADQAQCPGEGYPVGVQVGGCRGPGDEGADRVADDQAGPYFLVGQVRQAGAQDPSGAAQVALELVVPGLFLPPLVVTGGQLAGGGAVLALGIEDGGQQDDQLPGAGPVPVGDVVLDHPRQVGSLRAYSFEYFQDESCAFPLMAATGEIAGQMAVIYAAYHLQSHIGGSGVALPSFSHVAGARVTVIGYGHVGQAAVKAATALGADVTIYTWGHAAGRPAPRGSAIWPLDDPSAPARLADSDVIIGALRISTYDTPAIVTSGIVTRMRPGSVIVDVTAGFGAGYIETSDQLTSLSAPYRLVHGVKHIKIRQLPLGVHRSAAVQISRIYAPYVLRLVQSLTSGLDDPAVTRGTIVADGQILNEQIRRHYAHDFRE